MNNWTRAFAAAGVAVVSFAMPAAAQQQMSLLVGSEGGTMYRLGAALSEVFKDQQDDYRVNLTIGGGAANPARLGAGGAEFGFSFSNFAVSDYNGKGQAGREFKDLRHVGAFWGSCYHQYIAKELYDSGIKSWDDIVASEEPLAIGAGPSGTSTDAINRLLLEAYGTSFEELADKGFKFTYTSMSATSEQIRSGQVDIYFHNSGDPNGAGVEAALGRELTFMDPSDKLKETLADAGFGPCTIPGGIYENVDEDHESMGALGVMLAHKDTDPDAVYALLKTTHENLKTLAGAQKIFGSWTPEYGNAEYGVPLHPGAERFYKEVGAIN